MRLVFLPSIAIAFVFIGCAPKIISNKSPLNDLENQRCFTLPNKEYLSDKPIFKQKLYQLTEKSLRANNVRTYYGEPDKCKNYLMTDWDVVQKKEIVHDDEITITNNYGNVYANAYNKTNPYAYSGTSYSYKIPSSTYETTKHYASYTLRVGTINGDNFIEVWSGSQSGYTSAESAISIKDSDQSSVDAMVGTMLKEVK